MSFQVSSNFLNDEEQTKVRMATLGQELKSLRSELQEHRVNAVEGNSRTVDPNQKARQNAARFFCNYCRTNGHTPSWCRKKIRDEELKRIENERTAEKVAFTQDYKKNEEQIMDQNNGLESKISKEETRTLPTIDSGEVPLMPTRISLQDQILHIGTTIRIMEDHMTNAPISRSTEVRETDLETNLSAIRMETGGTMETFLLLHQILEKTSHKTIPIANQEMNNLTILRSADLKIDVQQTLHPMNRNFRRTIIRHHLLWFVSPQPMIP